MKLNKLFIAALVAIAICLLGLGSTAVEAGNTKIIHSKNQTCKNFKWLPFKCSSHKKICRLWKKQPRQCIKYNNITKCKQYKHHKGECKKYKRYTRCSRYGHKTYKKCKQVAVPKTKKIKVCKRVKVYGKRTCLKYKYRKYCKKQKKLFKCTKHAKIVNKFKKCKKVRVIITKRVKGNKKHSSSKKHGQKKQRSHKKIVFKLKCLKKAVKIDWSKCLKRKCIGKRCLSFGKKRTNKCKSWSKRPVTYRNKCKWSTKRFTIKVNKCKNYKKRFCAHRKQYKKCTKRYTRNCNCVKRVTLRGKCAKWSKARKYCAKHSKCCTKRCQKRICVTTPKKQ